MPGSNQRLLVVDDDATLRASLAALFQQKGYPVEQAASADEALERTREAEFDAVLSDIEMPGTTGIEMVGELRRIRPETPVVLMTAFGSLDSAVEAMRAGAFDSITKPFEPDAVLLTVERALERRALEQENRRLRRAVERLCAQPWKGNARELENMVERALALCDSPELQVDDLPLAGLEHVSGSDSQDGLLRQAAARRMSLRDLEDAYIDRVLDLTGGNKVQAARILGIDRKTLYRRAERRARRKTSMAHA